MSSKYPLLTFRLPTGSDPKQVRADFANVAKYHGYTGKYHKNSTDGSPSELILAIIGGECVTCPFADEWYNAALAYLKPLAKAHEGWAEALVKAIEAAQGRAIEADELDDIWDDYNENNQ